MRKIRRLFILVALVCFYILPAKIEFAQAGNTLGLSAQSVKEYIPKGPVTVDIMLLSSTQRLQELTLEIKKNISKDPEWFKEYTRVSGPGPLPYHPKLGISAQEYEEFLRLIKDGVKMIKSGQAVIEFKWLTPDLVEIISSGELEDINGIQIDLAHQKVKTSFGILDSFSSVNNTNPASPTGPWTGAQWKLENAFIKTGDTSSGVVAKFAIGRLANSGQGILYFNAKEVLANGSLRKSVRMLLYNL